ncbi:MAG: tetratricopeptide repeat protein [Burkholderiales bacterium]
MPAPSATAEPSSTAIASDAPPAPGAAQPLPRDLTGVISYADALAAGSQLHQAIGIYRNVLRQHPRILGVHFNLGVALLRFDHPQDAVLHFDTVLAAPDCPDWLRPRAHQALAVALEQSGETAAAAAEYRRLLLREPRNFAVNRQLATLYRDLGLTERALTTFERCLQLWPQHCGIALDAAVLRLALMDWDHPVVTDTAPLIQACLQPPAGVEPPAPHALLLLPGGLTGTQLANVARAHARYIDQSIDSPLPTPAPQPRTDRRLRLAYATSDVHGPATAWVRSLLRHHDRERFEVLLYIWGPDDGSAEREQSLADTDQVFDLAGWSDAAIAARLRAEDVLLDPGCIARASRPGVFARRPAPLQLAWLGDPLGAWSGWFDALVSDAQQLQLNTAPDDQPHGDSPVWVLPGSARLVPPTGLSRSESLQRQALGLPTRSPVLALFAEPETIHAPLWALFLRLARIVPGTALWLRAASPRLQDRLRKEATEAGLDASQLVFLPPLPAHALAARLQLADLALDIGRSEGGALALDALVAGVPMLTLRGQHPAHTIAASLMTAAGAPQAIADDLSEYEARARALLQQPRALKAWRERLASTPHAEQGRRTVRALEAQLVQQWDALVEASNHSSALLSSRALKPA